MGKDIAERKFDLNIEKILENWEIHHAIREIISNALDEQKITGTKEIEIFKDSNNNWHIRDYGRGLKYEHLTQKENAEKLETPNLIGKFGIGLKDALATFDRKNKEVLIRSKYGDIFIEKSEKQGFEDLLTLHACILPPSDKDLIGTEFILKDITDEEIKKAKNLFLKFSGDKILEVTNIGEILEKQTDKASIYINGLKVADEDNFLFSYNITSINAPVRKALNRERSNVGRSAYSDRIKSILLSCKNEQVIELIVDDLEKMINGYHHDEINWLAVQEYAIRILNSMKKLVFLTSNEIISHSHIVDTAKSGGYKIVTIPERLKYKIQDTKDISGNVIRDIKQFTVEYHESFEYKFVPIQNLNSFELEIFSTQKRIFELIGGKPESIKEIKISETMKKDESTFLDRLGIWEENTGFIIINRNQLQDLKNFSGTLLHEIGHVLSNATDVNRIFESMLTNMLGIICKKLLMLENK